ncbi:BUD13 homolog isoform X2 [Apus apus]|uniref:BUD13 homolog isoform X2 n=1 Tax=Apus apus TaxID=8895 RepID=UPI0021F82EE3|nr:BUD13 homolog isoform X2 [Apus apus]
MAAAAPSKAEYLRRYLSGPPAAQPAQPRRRRRKKPPGGAGRNGIRIVDDDVSWNSIAAAQEKEEEEDEGDMPVVAEFIDERPDEVKLMEEFRTNAKWKLLGDQNEDSQSSDVSVPATSTLRRQRHDSPDVSPKRASSAAGKKGWRSTEQCQPGGAPGEQSQLRHGGSDRSSSRQKRLPTPDLSPPRKKRQDSHPDLSPPSRKRAGSPGVKRQSRTKGASPATRKLRPVSSPQRCLRRDSRSPSPRRGSRVAWDAAQGPGHGHSDSPKPAPLKGNRSRSPDSDLSPPRRALPAGKEQHSSRSPPDLSPPRHRDAKGSPKKASVMFSGVKAGLVSADVLRREQQELRRQERNNKHLEEESRHSETVFRDKSGRKRDLAQERLEQRQKEEAKSERDEQYAKWGKGLAQGRQQQQNVEDAIKEMQKPLARYIDDQDLDRMLREQEREGDPMADFIKKRKAKENKEKKEKPRYNGPAPPLNRFNIWPGHRWDGVDRSNGFEQQHFARIANRKAVQEMAYKWSVEDM